VNADEQSDEEAWTAFKAAICDAVIKCLEAQGCRVLTREEQARETMAALSDPARFIR